MTIMLSVAISISVLFAVAGVYVYMVRKRAELNPRGCPGCDTPMPAFRWPTSFRQALRGGWTCENCGTEVDRHGMEISPAAK
jgi:hypothetical protein